MLLVFLAVLPNLALANLLTREDSERLKYKLQNIYNENELLLRNGRVDRSDIRLQERQFSALRVFDRIPFEDKWESLSGELEQSAKSFGIKLIRIERQKTKKVFLAPPKKVFSDERPYRLTDDQLAEVIPFRLQITGERSAVDGWIQSWPDKVVRLIESEGTSGKGPNRWLIRAHAYRFRDIRFPEIVPRDPIQFLPASAIKDPSRLASSAPELWKLITDIRQLRKQTASLYRNRGEFLLNGARMVFFVSKSQSPGSAGSH